MIELPIFKGYTVDIRLREFRKVNRYLMTIEFIKFDSKEGRELLDDYYNIKT